LDEGSVRRNACTYTGRHNTQKRGHTLKRQAGFEPTIPIIDCAVTGVGL